MSAADWERIEAEALEQTRAELDTRVNTPLVFGEHIAWAICRFGRTDDLSAVHRVGFPLKHEPYTTCGEKIPAPVLWMALNPRLIERMPSCRFCEAEYARVPKEDAA